MIVVVLIWSLLFYAFTKAVYFALSQTLFFQRMIAKKGNLFWHLFGFFVIAALLIRLIAKIVSIYHLQ